MKSLYARSPLFQWVVALLFLGTLVASVGIATIGTAILLGLRWDIPAQFGFAMCAHLIPLLPIWMFLALFLIAPLFRLAGVLRYYSPYLIASRSANGVLALHGATPFDYLLLFRWHDRGPPAVRRILLWYIDGLVSIAREIECGRLPINTTISATSYIFSGHSAKRYGFRIVESPWFSLGGILTYPTQFLTYSFARGHWAFPPILRARKAIIDGAELCSRIDDLERIQKRLHHEQDSATKVRKKDRNA